MTGPTFLEHVDMNPVPKVTVLMSVYNGERYVREAIESILTQTFTDFEFLIINDGSTDQSREMICAYPDPRMRLIDNDRNIGLTKSLNKGIALARGEYLARMDADDVCMPDRLEKQADFLDRTAIALVGSSFVFINSHNEELARHELPIEDHLLRTHLFFANQFIHASVMGRTRVFREFGYDADVAYAQDYLLWSRIALKYPVANLQEPLIRFRAHEASISQRQFAQQEETVKQVFRLHLETLLQRPVPSDVLERHYQLLRYHLKPKTMSCREKLRMLQWIDRLVRANERRQLYNQDLFRQRWQVYWNKFFSDDVFYHSGTQAIALLFSPCRQFSGDEKVRYFIQYVEHAFRYVMNHILPDLKG